MTHGRRERLEAARRSRNGSGTGGPAGAGCRWPWREPRGAARLPPGRPAHAPRSSHLDRTRRFERVLGMRIARSLAPGSRRLERRHRAHRMRRSIARAARAHRGDRPRPRAVATALATISSAVFLDSARVTPLC